MFENNKEVMKNRKSKKDIKHNGQKKMDNWKKKRSIYKTLCNKAKDQATRTPLKPEGEHNVIQVLSS
jgi:hypothetical protein